MGSVCTMHCSSAYRKKEILTYTIARMKLEDIMLSEVSPSQKTQTLYDSTHMSDAESRS